MTNKNNFMILLLFTRHLFMHFGHQWTSGIINRSANFIRLLSYRLRNKFPEIKSPKKDDICYATQNRQDAVKILMQDSDVLLVLGSSNSSNSNRLREIAEKLHKSAYLIDGADEIESSWLKGVGTIGVTAGASAPEVLVQEVINYLYDHGASEVIEVSGAEESVHFPVPEELR